MSDNLLDTREDDKRQWRILVVENDPIMCADHVRNLGLWGFDAYAAQGHGNDLLQDALRLARHRRCHLALVDMRLLDDNNPEDVSGFDLIKELWPVQAFVVSSYGSLQKASQAISRSGAKEFIGKEEGPRRLREFVIGAIQELSTQINEYDLWFKPPLTVNSLAISLKMSDAKTLSEELSTLAQQVFPTAKSLGLEEVPSSFRGRGTVLLIAQLNLKERVLLKLAPIEQIRNEEKSYKRLTFHIPNVSPYLLQSNFGYSWNIGCAVYQLSGLAIEKITDLATFYQHGTIEQIGQAIENAFAAWAGTYLSTKPFEQLLIDEYLGNTYQTNPEIPSDILPFEFSSRFMSNLPVPDVWVAVHREDSKISGTRSAITHGAFTTSILLLDIPSGEIYPSDYASIGWGHILRDFCMLEADILLRLADLSEEYLYETSLALTRSRETGESLQITERLFRHQGARKAFDVIARLRSLSLEMTRYGDQKEYYWALLLSAMKLASSEPSASDLHKRARLLAGIICARLDHWDEAGWPGPEWTHVEWVSQQKRLRYEAEIRSLQKERLILEQQIAPYTAAEISRNLIEKRDRVLSELAAFGEIPFQLLRAD